MNYWLVKTEPSLYSITNLKLDKVTLWDMVRNYQARNFLKSMEVADFVLLYHSNVTDANGVYGLAQVKKVAIPDPTQFDRKSEGFDSGSAHDAPRWWSPTIGFKEIFQNPVLLHDLKKDSRLKQMQLLKRGNRLSVLPVSETEFNVIILLAKETR